jgi:CRISPR-associated protein Cas2
MTEQIYHIVVSYDKKDEKRLTKIGKVMKNYGERVLLSVWECNLTYGQFEYMRNQVESIIDHMEDSVRYYFLCDKCIKKVQFSGLGAKFLQEQELVIC